MYKIEVNGQLAGTSETLTVARGLYEYYNRPGNTVKVFQWDKDITHLFQ